MDQTRIVYCAWEDINTEGDPWVKLPEKVAPCLCRTVGWLLRDEPSYIVVSATIGEPDGDDDSPGALHTVAIPKSCISRMDFLTLETLLKQFEE